MKRRKFVKLIAALFAPLPPTQLLDGCAASTLGNWTFEYWWPPRAGQVWVDLSEPSPIHIEYIPGRGYYMGAVRGFQVAGPCQERGGDMNEPKDPLASVVQRLIKPLPPLPDGKGNWPIWLHEGIWFCTANRCPAVLNGLPV